MTIAAKAKTLEKSSLAPRRVSILGSTGSIGRSTLDLIARSPGAFEVVALAANTRADDLLVQARALRPDFVAIGDERYYTMLRDALQPLGIEVGAGAEAVSEAGARDADWVMAAIVGSAGLKPALKAAERGATIALANKECLVCAGSLFLEAAARGGARLLPVDSEHNAIFQVLDETCRDRVERLILTASGGPFRNASLETMAKASRAEALAHPNWAMGAKISIDSATMMNKGLEIIEASYLFDMPEERIDVLVHPQSVVHSLVAYVDGSVLAQLGTPDMRTPIAHALAWPDRMPAPAARLDLAAIGTLTFERPDLERFPALGLARASLKSGGAAPTVLNAANEVAVEAFLAGRIGFLEIVAIVDHTMDKLGPELGGKPPGGLEDIWDWDARARAMAAEAVVRRAGTAGVPSPPRV